MNATTPHSTAKPGDYAKTVLMPGDPLRAKYIAETFLTDVRLVNNVRGIQGHTGLWKGVPVSVQASGMGIPSIGIYAWELYRFFGVENIIRIGTAGALADELELMDLVLGMGACTDSNFMHQYGLDGSFAPIADWTLLRTAAELAAARGLPVRVGNLLSTDCFYTDGEHAPGAWKKMGVLAVEMEAAGLYATAARAGRRALCMCSVSDHFSRPQKLSPEQRQTALSGMIELALDTAAAL
ncbi:MAG: purine-nucleoside phosphorylase [Clostridiales bacterium]|nr:purine-nucleoside phosphorylase [Clostridiales bacterium]